MTDTNLPSKTDLQQRVMSFLSELVNGQYLRRNPLHQRAYELVREMLDARWNEAPQPEFETRGDVPHDGEKLWPPESRCTECYPVETTDLPIEQEPKYTVRDGRLVNRASGKPIPDDEPVFVLRAKDKNAVYAIMNYRSLCLGNPDHYAAVDARVGQFLQFKESHPLRMKSPDTVLNAVEPECSHVGVQTVCACIKCGVVLETPKGFTEAGKRSVGISPEKANERRGTPSEEADWAEFGDCPRCWLCSAPVIAIPGCAPGCIRNCPPQPSNGDGL